MTNITVTTQASRNPSTSREWYWNQVSSDAYREGHSGGSICTAECWSPRCLASCLQISKGPVKMKRASYYFGQMSSSSC
ncbi:hypothetical protein LEMLEM_LOCUS24948 [Lemmus lemmus]